jgi:hypothetical protein
MLARLYGYGEEYKIVWFKGGAPEGAGLGGGHGGSRDDAAKLACNISRARSRIIELALCNNWEWFVTLTIDGNKQSRENLDGYVKDFGNWVGNFNKKYDCKLKYLLIPEQHKDGKSWHMHGLLHDVPEDALTVNEHGYYDIPYYRERFGFVSLSRIRDKSRCARYITKYVSKSLTDRADDVGKHLYYASRGLLGRVQVADLHCMPVPSDAYQNDYTISKWYTNHEEVAAILEQYS